MPQRVRKISTSPSASSALVAAGDMRALDGSALFAALRESLMTSMEHAATIAEEAERRSNPNDERSVALAALCRGWAHFGAGALRPALDAALEALRTYAAGPPCLESASAQALAGDVYSGLGQPREAADHAERALELARACGAVDVELDSTGAEAALLLQNGQIETAFAVRLEALERARTLGLRAQQANLLVGLGHAYLHTGQYAASQAAYREAYEIADEIGNVRFRSYAAGGIATVTERLGAQPVALEWHLRALHDCETLGDRAGVGAVRNNLGAIYRRMGRYAPALESFVAAHETASAIGERSGEMVALANIATLYEALDERSRVPEYYGRALATAEELGDRTSAARILMLTGRFHSSVGNHELALVNLYRSLREHQELSDRYGEIAASINLATALRVMGDLARAREHASRAATMSAAAGDTPTEARARLELAEILAAGGDRTRAIAELRDVLAAARAAGATELVIGCLDRLATFCEEEGRRREAGLYRRMHDDGLRELFDSDGSHRVRALVGAFDRGAAHRRASELGVDGDDLEHIAASLAMLDQGTIEPPAPMGPRVSVRALGELRVTVGDRQIAPSDWGRRRARELFRLLLLNHQRPMSVDVLLEKLGGEPGDRNAEMVLMNAVSHVRRALEPDRPARDRTTYLRLVDGAYTLDLGDDARIDFLTVKSLIAAARRATSSEERRRLYEEAIAWYDGDLFPEDRDAEWVDTERSLLRDAWLEALEFVASEQLRQERLDEAISTARAILGRDTTSELAHEVLLSALSRRGRHAEVRAAADTMKRAFHEEYGTAPPERLARMGGEVGS